jgi:hypothetical protein
MGRGCGPDDAESSDAETGGGESHLAAEGVLGVRMRGGAVFGHGLVPCLKRFLVDRSAG